MKNKYILFILLLTSSLGFGQAKDWEFLPPFNFHVDSTTLLATWEAPKIVLLQEDFEGDEFPPAGWADTSLGVGWMQTSDPDFWFWHFSVPASTIALVNDDLIPSNNGSLDYLVTPPLDLTVADSFYLVFDSYFDGGYGQQAFIEYSLDNGTSWQMLHQVDASLEWENVRVDLSGFSGTEGVSNILISFLADDNGYFASGWALDNVLICSDDISENLVYYKIFLDSLFIEQVTENHYQYGYKYATTHSCGILARYLEGKSDTVQQTITSSCFPKPDSLSGIAPDDAAILTWAPPQVSYEGPAMEQNRDVGDVILSFPSPPPISSCYGVCDDGEYMWISDPSVSTDKIYKIDYYNGVNTGETITINQGQSWIGDMVSDGFFLYACLIGGPNAIAEVYIPTGQTIRIITGDFSIAPQYGLAADFTNEEFYIGGWNYNRIWRTDFNGVTIDSHAFNNVSGLAFDPLGGPWEEGTLWVMVRAANTIVTEIDPNNNWITCQSFAMTGAQPNSGAGIEIATGGNLANALWVCDQVDNTISLVDLDEPCCGPSGIIPDNLLGFNLYKNGEFLDYVEYTAPDSCGYIDPVDWSEWNEGIVLDYQVSAVYDMTPYGFPGETGESLPDGPAEIYLFNYWFELNFLEDWSAGTFNDNAWFITDSSWQVSQDIGYDAPCAIFMPDTVMNNYNAALQSFHFLEQSTGEIILQFDVALSCVNPTGNEKLEVQVFDYPSKTWNTIRTITNLQGSLDWPRVSQDISGYFNNNAFRIRFNATGENSSDINYWAVDNIAITRVCPNADYLMTVLFPPPENNILVDWDEPMPPIADWLHFDDGQHDGSAGFGTGKESWTGIAARWTPEMLKNYKGAELTKIGFIPSDLRAFFKVAVWIGENTTPVYVQATDDLGLNEYNIVQLDYPVNIDITQDLYVGYLISAYTGYPISLDDGPAIDGYGNMVLNGNPLEWKTLRQINPDLDFNWNVQAYFERDGVPFDGYYSVYRSIDDNPFEVIAETTESEYYDSIDDGAGLYCYRVTCSFYDSCITNYLPGENCVVITESPSLEPENDGFVNIYPNPASDVLFIESSENIEMISIFNSQGEEVRKRRGEKGRMRVPVDGLAPGLYLVHLETSRESVNRKIIIKQ